MSGYKMFKRIAKSCLSVLTEKSSPEKSSPELKAPVAKTARDKDDLVVDMMSAVF